MKKCYISGKITGLPFQTALENFAFAKQEVKALGFEPVSPMDLKHDHGKTWREFMVEDLKAMLDCEVIYCLKNWIQSPGAVIEVQTGLLMGLDIIKQPA